MCTECHCHSDEAAGPGPLRAPAGNGSVSLLRDNDEQMAQDDTTLLRSLDLRTRVRSATESSQFTDTDGDLGSSLPPPPPLQVELSQSAESDTLNFLLSTIPTSNTLRGLDIEGENEIIRRPSSTNPALSHHVHQQSSLSQSLHLGTFSQSNSGTTSYHAVTFTHTYARAAAIIPNAKFPPELREMIVSHLDAEPYTLFNLMLTSKAWYNTLCVGVKAQRDWKRRAELLPYDYKGTMFPPPRPLRIATWKSIYIKSLKGLCIMCLGGHMPLLHGLVRSSDGPSWIKICEDCATRPGPLQIIDRRTATWTYLLDKNHLDTLPKAWLRPGDYWGPRYLKRYIVDLEEKSIQRVFENVYTRDHYMTILLRSAIIAGKRERIWPIATTLETEVRSLLTKAVSDDTDLENIIGYHTEMQIIVEEVGHILLKHGTTLDTQTRPSLYHEYQDGTNKTWLDALVQGDKQVDAYIEAVLQYNKKFRSIPPWTEATTKSKTNSKYLSM